MRRTLIIGAIVATALAVVGVAAGQLRSSGVDTAAVSFTATTVENARTRTCTGSDGAYEISYARYTGLATSSNADLAGPVALRVKSVYNTTKKLGWVEGWFRVKDGEDERNGHGHFVAVNTAGVLDGFLSGRVNRHYASIAGSLVASFSAAGGFTSGQIGGGAPGPNTAIVAGKPCDGKPAKPAVKLIVTGTVDPTSTATAIVVKPSDGSAPQTCAIGPGSPKTEGLVGKTVKIECAQVNSVMTLVRINARGNHGD